MRLEYNKGESFSNNYKIFEGALSCMIIMAVIIPYALHSNSGLLQIALYISYICSAMIVVSTALTFPGSQYLKYTIALILMMLWAVFISGHRYSLRELGNMINFMCMQSTIMGCTLMPSRKRLITRFAIFNMLLTIYYFFLLQTDFDTWEGFRTFGFGNPNLAAVFLMLSAVELYISIDLWKRKIIKILNILILSGIIFMIYCTGSRSCFYSVIICIVLPFFNRRVLPKWIIPVIVLAPLAFLFLYTVLFNNGLLLGYQLMGRTIYSGREIYFQIVLSEWKQYILFGDFFKHQMGNLHNGYLSILASFGIFTFLIYLFHNISQLEYIRRTVDNKISYISLIVILSTYFQMMSESVVTTGNYSVMLYIGMFYYMATFHEIMKNE